MLLDYNLAMIRLLTAHKILISAALVLSLILVAWGAVHGARGEPGAWAVFAVGVTAIPVCALYLRKLYRNPPLR